MPHPKPTSVHAQAAASSRRSAALLVCALLTLPAAVRAGLPGDLQERLTMTAQALREELAGVNADQAAFRPAPDRWSVLECVEHIVLAEGAVTRVLAALEPAARAGDGTQAPPISDAELSGFATDRSRRFEAPGEIRPTGRFATLEDAMAAFGRGREDLLEVMAAASGDLRATGAVNPAVERFLDGVQWGLLAAGHVERHTLQIREVKASPGYPSP